MPRLKKEVTDLSELQKAANTFSSYRDRIEDWRLMESQKKTNILRDMFRIQDSWSCLSSTCDKTYGSAPGMHYHLEKCGIPTVSTPTRRSNRLQKTTSPAIENAIEALAVETPEEPEEPNVSRASRPGRKPRRSIKTIPNDEAAPDDITDKDVTPKKERKSPIEEFLSYKDRLDDWRQLSDKEQSHILRSVFLESRKSWNCLSSSCEVKLGTYNGLQYHMRRCGIPPHERDVKCTLCGESMAKSKISEHKLAIHGTEALYALKATTPKSKLKGNTSSIGDDSAIGTDQVGLDVSQSNDLDTGETKRRRRVHLSLARSTRAEYSYYMARCYENLIKQNFKVESDLFRGGMDESSWKPLEHGQAEAYLFYVDDSVRINVEGFHAERETVSMRNFQVIKTDKGFVAFCGSSVTSAAWCPINGANTQYLISVLNSEFTTSPDDENSTGTFQLWSLDKEKENFCMEYIIAHDYGMITDVKWCPSGQWKLLESQLGALAVTSSLGEVGIYLIRDPCTLSTAENSVSVYKPSPHLRLHSGITCQVYSIDWSPFKNHDEIVAGLADGSMVLWRLSTRGDSNMIDDDGRLLPVLCLDVTNTITRRVRWWSETKVLVASLDRQISLWDLELGTCVASYVSGYSVTFDTLGSFFPAIAFCADTSQVAPSVTLVDFICSETRLTMPVTNAHSAVVWGISMNPWTGEILTVDDKGTVGRSCAPVLDGFFDSKRRKFIEEAYMKSHIQRDDQEEIYDYGEAKRKWTLKYSYKNKAPSRAETDKEFKAKGLSGQFPLAALFTVAWNANKEFNRWACFGGQTGLLHVANFENR